MASGYLRQSAGSIVTGGVIQASHFNAEYNALQAAFSGSTGHDHSGGAGMGPIIAPEGGGTPIFVGGTVSGTANAIVIAATTPDTFSLVDKYTVFFRPTTPNTGAATINVNGTGAVTIKKITPDGYLDLGVADLIPTSIFVLVYDAANNVFQSLATQYQPTPIVTASGFIADLGDVLNKFVMTSAAVITLPSTITVPQWYTIEVEAYGGAVTLTPNGTDMIQGGSAGASYVIPQGTSGLVYIGSDYKWYINGTALTQPITAGGTGGVSASAARTNLGVAIGTDVQAFDATLTALAAYNTNGLLTQTGVDTFVGRTLTGTSGTITITNGNGVSGNPTVTIDSGYIGQASITTLGTITTGVWSGTEVAINKGGTGQTTASAAFNALAPSQTSNSGKYLTTNGTTTSWGTITAGFGDPGANGIVVRTALNTSTARTITGSTNISVTNGDGVSGNPTLTFTGTVLASNGGTGLTTLTANNLLVGAGTSSVTFIAPGTSGNILTSNGTTFASTTPAFVKQIKHQVFTATGTYTPTAGMLYCRVTLQGPGSGASVGAANNGGGAGACVIKIFSAATIGASQAVTITAGGTSGNGAAGSATFGALLTAAHATGRTGAVASGGDINIDGSDGTTAVSTNGWGGSSVFGSGGVPGSASAKANSGAGGGSTAGAGGAGGSGYCFIEEFLSV